MASPVLPYLLVGDKSVARDRASLRAANIRYVVNVTPPLTSGGIANFFERERGIEYLRLPLRDVAADSVLAHVPTAVEFIQRARVRADARVLVHCNEGRSRSVAVVAAFLIRAYGQTLDEAMGTIRAAHPRAEPREQFLKQLATLIPITQPCDVDGYRPTAVSAKRPSHAAPSADAPPSKRAIGVIGPAIGPSTGPGTRGPIESAAPLPIIPDPPLAIGPTSRPTPQPSVGPLIGPASKSVPSDPAKKASPTACDVARRALAGSMSKPMLRRFDSADHVLSSMPSGLPHSTPMRIATYMESADGARPQLAEAEEAFAQAAVSKSTDEVATRETDHL